MKKDVLIYFDLITCIRTTQEVDDLISEIDTFMVKKNLDLISTISVKKIREAFAKNDLDIKNDDTLVRFLTTLKGLLKKFKIIKLVVAFCPSYKMIENIHNFVKENIGVGYILDIEILDEVLGGAIIIYNGRYYDFTLKKTIENAFKEKGGLINSFVG